MNPGQLGPAEGVIAPAAQLQLTPKQRAALAIFDAVQPTDGEVKAPGNVPATVGAQVPPATEFYILPDNGHATAPEAKGIIHRVAQSRVVPVDPMTTRVVDVIRSKAKILRNGAGPYIQKWIVSRGGRISRCDRAAIRGSRHLSISVQSQA